MEKRHISDVHQEIAEEAASIANQTLKGRPDTVPFGVHGVFAATPRRLSLTINNLITDPELLEPLREIGFAALRQAILERPDLTVGMILGDAREGRDYFVRHK